MGGTSAAGGEPIVVSVGLLPAPHHRGLKKAHTHAELYPLDQFTLDIQSS